MPTYAADDVKAIFDRMKEIATEEKTPAANNDINSAAGRDLDLLANQHDLYRYPGEYDYGLRARIKARINGA